MSTFAEWQPRWARHGVPTFPVEIAVDGKKPAVRGYLETDERRSSQFALAFPDADAFGFACGPRSKLTIVDMDSTDEAIIAEGVKLFGESPLLWRTGGGKFAAAYRFNGEPRRIRPIPSLPIDLLGVRGFAVAPPSQGATRRYEIIKGSLADIDRLPAARILNEIQAGAERAVDARRAAGPAPSRGLISNGKRNDALFRFALHQARHVDDLAALTDVVATRNASACEEPLPDDEVGRLAASAWRYQERGQNMVGSGGMVITSADEIDTLAARDPDGLALLLVLRRFHFGHDRFALTKAFAEKLGWRLPRYRGARDRLVQGGLLRCVHPGGRGPHDVPQYALT
jgi:hypothetical protein